MNKNIFMYLYHLDGMGMNYRKTHIKYNIKGGHIDGE